MIGSSVWRCRLSQLELALSNATNCARPNHKEQELVRRCLFRHRQSLGPCSRRSSALCTQSRLCLQRQRASSTGRKLVVSSSSGLQPSTTPSTPIGSCGALLLRLRFPRTPTRTPAPCRTPLQQLGYATRTSPLSNCPVSPSQAVLACPILSCPVLCYTPSPARRLWTQRSSIPFRHGLFILS
jgi:hypothetical protein